MRKMTSEEIKKTELELLNVFDEFCRENGLKYVLDSGTLLGAIRHNGFIPWDDDIDVIMPYPDFEKFIKLFEAQDDYNNIDVIYYMKKNAAIPFAKLIDDRTIVISPNRDKAYRYSVWIDIFPMFSVSNDDDEAKEQVQIIYDCVHKSWKHMKNRCKSKNPLRRIKTSIDNRRILKDCINTAVSTAKRYPYGTTKRLRLLSGITAKTHFPPLELFDDCIYHEFEGKQFLIPRDYDSVLRSYYGDYMQLPPENERYGHTVEAYYKD